MPFADLHTHSYYSDGTMSPAEIAHQAQENGVALLAVTDHDMLQGSRELRQLCAELGIGYIPGVELDTLENGVNFHVLGLGVDLYNPAFVEFVQANRMRLDRSSDNLIAAMQSDHANISMQDYEMFKHDRRLGGWKALQYLLAKGCSSSLKDGLRFYAQYGCSYDTSGFPSIAEVCVQIKVAGGVAILAHPGELIDSGDIGAFKRELRQLIAFGIDGIECYYPTHSAEVTAACLEICKENELLITAGSDCHGGFGRSCVGEMGIELDMLTLGRLGFGQSSV